MEILVNSKNLELVLTKKINLNKERGQIGKGDLDILRPMRSYSMLRRYSKDLLQSKKWQGIIGSKKVKSKNGLLTKI